MLTANGMRRKEILFPDSRRKSLTPCALRIKVSRNLLSCPKKDFRGSSQHLYVRFT
jgi:hypothetical protein